MPDRHHGFGIWECDSGEALVLEFLPAPCDYWILQLCNIWQENLDNYEDGDGYVQKYTAVYEPDGSVRVVIAEEDPGIGGNWIRPYGHVHGGMSLRLIKITGEPPQVTLHRLALAELRAQGLAALATIEPTISGDVGD